MLPQVSLGIAGNALALRRCDRFGGGRDIGAGLDFYEGDNRAAARDNVDFAKSGAPPCFHAPCDNAPSSEAEYNYTQQFCQAPAFFSGNAAHGPARVFMKVGNHGFARARARA